LAQAIAQSFRAEFARRRFAKVLNGQREIARRATIFAIACNREAEGRKEQARRTKCEGILEAEAAALIVVWASIHCRPKRLKFSSCGPHGFEGV
jgi:hypothetical protein